jgi:integrase
MDGLSGVTQPAGVIPHAWKRMSYGSKRDGVTGGPTRGGDPLLMRRLRERVRRLHYSKRTEQAYAAWVWRFIAANDYRDPRHLGHREVEAFLTRLANDHDVAAGTQNQALAAILFLYREVLRVELPWMEDLVRAKRPRRVPVVLSRDEVSRMLAVLDGQSWLMAALLYGTGMRLMECVRLRVKDVDFARNEIVVRDGKRGERTGASRCRSACATRCRRRWNGCGCCMRMIWRTEQATCGCRMRWRRNFPPPGGNSDGSTSSRHGACRRTRAARRSGATTWTKACCSAP